ncbi:hypothetical protein [Piscinibacter sp.]|uniref:hypothetical protein n=1 Tax=Piscinibacter sp. TaxID=1903157 RepID=UPI002D010DE6|nr:hypothetical protein [Albitalea sp.]HUG23380.1 hypothetical protein [Albitalea sp.]
MTESWTKRLLWVAAAWNILGGASALWDPAQHFAQLYTASLSLDDPLQLFFYRCTWINVIAWGVAYALAAMLPLSRTVVLAAGAAGKSAYFVACAALFAGGTGSGMLLAAGIVDVLMAGLFVAALLPGRRVRALSPDGQAASRARP